MSRAKNLCSFLEDEEEFNFPTKDREVYPFNTDGAISSLERKLNSLGIEGIQIEDMEADDKGNIIVSFSDYDDNLLDVVFSCGEEGMSAIIVGENGDAESEDNIVVDLDPLGVPVVNTEKGPYINLLVLDWLNKSTIETILTAGALMDKKTPTQHIQKDAVGNLIIIPIPTESYQFDIESFEKDLTINENLDEVVYKIVVRGGKKVRRPIVRRLRKKRLTAKQRAGIRKASRTRKSPKSKAKKRKSTLLRKRLHLKPGKSRRGFRVG